MLAAIASAARVRPARHAFITPAAAPVYAVTAASGAFTAMLLAWRGLALSGQEFPFLAMSSALLLLLAFALRTRGWEGMATLVETWTLLSGFCVLLTLMTFGLGAGSARFADSILADTDRWLLPGFDWAGAMRFLGTLPFAMKIANLVYASLDWQPPALLVACAATGRSSRCWTFLTAWIVTLLPVVGIFALFPGLGAYAHFGIAAAEVPLMRDPTPWVQPDVLHALRDGSLRVISFGGLEGIVTFPSFHAGAALLLGWGFWPVARLRWPFVTLNAVMAASAIPIGGHYVVDIIAGVMVAAAGIAVARMLERRRPGAASDPRS